MTFWTDAKVVEDFTPEDKLFYFYLLTNPHTNLIGCYEITVRQISNELGYSKDSVENLIKRFEIHHQNISYDRTTKELLVVNWSKFNWTKSPKLIIAVEKSLKNVKNEVFREFLEDRLIDEEIEWIPYPYPMDTPIPIPITITSSIKERGIVKGENKKQKYGSQENVLLTENEYQKLQDEYPKHYEKYIEDLSLYIASKGKKYKSHNATIRNWIRRDLEKGTKVEKDIGIDGSEFGLIL